MNLIKTTNKKNVQLLIDYFLNELNPGETGYSYTLTNRISINELCASYEEVLEKSLALEAIRKMIKNNKRQIEDFEKLYATINMNKSKSKPTLNKYTGFFPLYIKTHHNIKLPFSMTILGYKFTFANGIPYSKKILKYFPSQLYQYEKNVKEHIVFKKPFLRVAGTSKNEYIFIDEISKPYNILRAVFQFTCNYGGSRLFGYSPISLFPHPSWSLILNDKKEFIPVPFIYDEFIPTSPFELTVNKLTITKKNSNILKKMLKKDSSIQILADSLNLFIEALDEKHLSNRFIGLWQTAESLTLAYEAHGDTKRTAKRLAYFGKNLSFLPNGYQNILLKLADKRNNLIHAGISNIKDDDINNLKFAIENALLWYFKNVNKLPTCQHISQYYNLRKKSKRELKIISQCLNYLT